MTKNSWLASEGKSLFEAAAKIFSEKNSVTPAALAALQKKFPDAGPELIRKAFTLAEGTAQARKLGKYREGNIYSRSIAEQMTAPGIAHHHAGRFAGREHILEICTGSGSDTAALAARAHTVSTIEADDFTADIAEHNFHNEGLGNIRILRGAAESIVPELDPDGFDALWADPARRSNAGKVYSADDYLPPLPWIMSLAGTKLCGIKISPGLDIVLPEGWAREWIGFKSECREQVLWKNSGLRDGTVTLFDGEAEEPLIWEPGRIVEPSAILSSGADDFAGSFLVEPHAALIRSGYLSSFFAECGISIVDEKIAYGICAGDPGGSAFYRRFRVEESFVFSMKLLRRKIAERNWNRQTEIKKRGFFLDSDEIRKKIKFPDSAESGVVVLCRRAGDHLCFLCKRV